MNDPLPAPPVIEIVPLTTAHIREIKENLRHMDKVEIEAYGVTSGKGLWMTYKRSLMSKTALIDGKVAAIWGCGGTYLGDLGVPWLITSNEVNKISPLKFARVYQREVKEMLEIFPTLSNYVLAEYAEAVRLLSICGFDIYEPQPMGNGVFRQFIKTAPTEVAEE